MSLVPGGEYQWLKLHDLATAIGDGVTLSLVSESLGAASALGLQIDGITAATITFKIRLDPDMEWVNILAENITTGTEATTATADGIYRITALAAGIEFKAQITTYTGSPPSGGIITVRALVTP